MNVLLCTEPEVFEVAKMWLDKHKVRYSVKQTDPPPRGWTDGSKNTPFYEVFIEDDRAHDRITYFLTNGREMP